jgi:hypothetical protein
MATNKNIKIEFTSDFSNCKKGDVREFNKSICKTFVYELKVAKFYEEKPKTTKTKK